MSLIFLLTAFLTGYILIEKIKTGNLQGGVQVPTGGIVRDLWQKATADPVKVRYQQLQSGWKKRDKA